MIREIGKFSWNDHTNNYGFNEDSETFKLLPTKVPPTNRKIRIIVRLHTIYNDESCNYDTEFSYGEISKVFLPMIFTYNDVASGVYEVVIDQSADGNIVI